MKTRLEILCEMHKQQGGTIHQFNELVGFDLLALSNKDFFKFVYGVSLKQCHKAFPEEYGWPESQIDVVLGRMLAAIDRMSFNKDSKTFKLACKRVGIKHTYQAIAEYVK